jgi:hypothetical protein
MRPLGLLAGGVLGLVCVAGAAQAADPFRDPKFAVRPYGGAPLGDTTDQAQAGAMIEFGPGRERDNARGERAAAKLKEMGVRDGAEFGDKGRWYAFVGGSGTTLGLNMQRDPDGLLKSYGFSVDPAAAVGDAQAGVGWRKGDFQASLGYVHRTFKPAYAMQNIDFDNKDQMVGVSFSLKPQPKR